MIDNENLILANDQNNQINKDDLGIRKLQHNLFMMGFDIVMINKIINIFNIKTEDEAIDYLIKNEDGMWKHPFIPKEDDVEEEEPKNILLTEPKNVMNNVFSKIKSASSDLTKDKNIINKINNDDDNDNYILKNNDDICEICGEGKQFHLIKEFNSNNNLDFIGEDFDEIKNIEEVLDVIILLLLIIIMMKIIKTNKILK